MNLVLLGATGQVGSHLLNEALSRGHAVTGVARYVDSLPKHPSLQPKKADATDYTQLSAILSGNDAVLSALPFRHFDGPDLLATVKAARVPRLLVVGGAGSLEVAPGHALVDSPDFPAEYRAEALAGRDFLQVLRAETTLDWTFLSPSAFLHDGPRTGKFRLGKDSLLVAADGESHISLADYAIAFLDELEHPHHNRTRFTVGY
ncbi:MAG: NAD(P)-dependent oxidoreductase [Nibricoccus sp.]